MDSVLEHQGRLALLFGAGSVLVVRKFLVRLPPRPRLCSDVRHRDLEGARTVYVDAIPAYLCAAAATAPLDPWYSLAANAFALALPVSGVRRSRAPGPFDTPIFRECSAWYLNDIPVTPIVRPIVQGITESQRRGSRLCGLLAEPLACLSKARHLTPRYSE